MHFRRVLSSRKRLFKKDETCIKLEAFVNNINSKIFLVKFYSSHRIISSLCNIIYYNKILHLNSTILVELSDASILTVEPLLHDPLWNKRNRPFHSVVTFCFYAHDYINANKRYAFFFTRYIGLKTV